MASSSTSSSSLAAAAATASTGKHLEGVDWSLVSKHLTQLRNEQWTRSSTILSVYAALRSDGRSAAAGEAECARMLCCAAADVTSAVNNLQKACSHKELSIKQAVLAAATTAAAVHAPCSDASTLPTPVVLFVNGPLGVGKTTTSEHLTNALGSSSTTCTCNRHGAVLLDGDYMLETSNDTWRHAGYYGRWAQAVAAAILHHARSGYATFVVPFVFSDPATRVQVMNYIDMAWRLGTAPQLPSWKCAAAADLLPGTAAASVAVAAADAATGAGGGAGAAASSTPMAATPATTDSLALPATQPLSVLCFRLTATDETVVERVKTRGNEDLEWELHRCVELNSTLGKVGKDGQLGEAVDANKSIAAVQQTVVDRVGLYASPGCKLPRMDFAPQYRHSVRSGAKTATTRLLGEVAKQNGGTSIVAGSLCLATVDFSTAFAVLQCSTVVPTTVDALDDELAMADGFCDAAALREALKHHYPDSTLASPVQVYHFATIHLLGDVVLKKSST